MSRITGVSDVEMLTVAGQLIQCRSFQTAQYIFQYYVTDTGDIYHCFALQRPREGDPGNGSQD